MNTLEIDTLLKKHPHSRPVFKGVYARNRLPKHTFGPCGKYGSRPSNGTTLGRYIHRRQLKRVILRPYWNTTLFKGLHELYEQTLYELDLQYSSSTRRRIYRVRTSLHFLTHSSMCRTYMTDVTRLLENPVEATTIVQNFALLLVKHVF